MSHFLRQKWLQPLWLVRRQLSFLIAAAALLLAGTPARADVWGYVDSQGVAHFSAERLDERYQLFFRSGESFDTSRGGKASPGAYGNGMPGAPPKLLAFFDVSPNYKAVKHLLREASVAHDIDYELLQALIATESGFNTHAVSPKGAVGLMQLMPPTAQRYGVRADKNSPIEKKLTDPKTNIRAGSRYLRYLIDLFPGQLELAVAAYNAGEGAVQRYGNKIPNYPETKNYVKTVMQLYSHLKPPSMIGEARRSGRVRMEMMGGSNMSSVQPAGGATGRGNQLPTLVVQSPVAPEFRVERD
ncbi:MAG: lytic transglycosylase domain-containing protein [Polaromonas sp.]|uniref:lytic transglycosylase domain-containing protein n=1 Tax=Polaromonas sp. TaxID=1869339 RepID=UPI0027321443|nr:lytic transglycosylase domain-containing protein [Polaromonas sp.]MDP3250162.1 lytic transglycosylase domain-containing protein [Polaromonas sp.]MDP3757283.1 lytic transglycosylase domain-containing protein [Polaromonas sp.]